MIAALLLSVLPVPNTASLPSVPVLQDSGTAQDSGAADVDAQIAAAGEDVSKLMELAKTFSSGGDRDAAKKVYERVIEIDPNHEEAHKALRHHFYDNQWFTSYAELSKYRREETAKMKEKGLVRWKDEWVAEADKPYLDMGWVKGENGKWADPVAAARDKQVAEWKAKGYQYRADDSSWVAPEDMAHWNASLWKCGDEWVDMEKANAYHSQIGQWWQKDGEHFVAWSTCDWEGANYAAWYADQIYPDMVRLFGVQPTKKPHFVVLNSLDQYNQAAGGNPPLLPETEGISSVHGAYFADGFIVPDQATGAFQYLGCGVSWWDRAGDMKLWGPYWLRWAAAQSYCEAIDPSWNAISEFIAAATGGGQPSANNFWSEKLIPRWMRYGAASYAERFLKDPQAGDGGNPWAIREGSFAKIKENGGMHKVEDIFAFAIDLNDPDNTSRLYQGAGRVVAYLLDGADGDKKLREKHSAFKATLKAMLSGGGDRKDYDKAVDALQKELAKSERDIKKYADL